MAITLLVVELPYLLAYALEARGWVFTGMLWAPHDAAQYLAAMREGAAGSSWLIHDHLTGEPHGPVFVYPLYVGLGKLAAAFGLSPERIFHASEIAARGTLLVAIYLLSSAVFSAVGRRRLAFLVVTFSSGLAFWLLLLNEAVRPFVGDLRTFFDWEFGTPEMSTFLVQFTASHLMLALALLMLTIYCYLVSWSKPGPVFPALSVLLVLGLGLVHPFSLVTLCVVFPVHLAMLWAQRGRPPREAMLSVVLAFLASAPAFAYNVLVFGADPFWHATYGQHDLTPSPPLPLLVVGLAPVLCLAARGIRAFLCPGTPACWLVVVWIILSLVLMYVPLGMGYQRRFAYGLQPMLALVATVGLEPFWQPRLVGTTGPSPVARGPLTFCLLLLLFGSAACLYGSKLHTVVDMLHTATSVSPNNYFRHKSLRDAGSWLATVMAPDDVLLADRGTAAYLAGIVPGRVFVGHPVATLHYFEKEEAMQRFYSQDNQEDRRSFLVANRIRYAVYGPHERALQPVHLASSYLAPVYVADEVVVYEVQPSRPEPGRQPEPDGLVLSAS